MNVIAAKEMKRALEQRIAGQLEEYTRQTGIVVTGITAYPESTAQFHDGQTENGPYVVGVRCEL